MKEKICVVGLGYIGLPTSAMFASHGHEVIGVDVNEEVVKALNKGEIIIEEPYLDILVQAAVTSGNLKAYTEPKEADAFILAVPTPITKDKKADMTYVKKAAEAIVPYLKKGNLVILESTSPTGTTQDLIVPILEKSGLKIGEELYVGHSPERVLPGQILMELVHNNRIIGGINKESAEKIKELYSTFVKSEMYTTTATTAEMCKMMENTFRDVNIALANELAKLCENIGINAWEVIELCNKHPRVNIHQPGPGVGGHCLAVDPWFIVEKLPELANIIKLSRDTNDSMPEHVCKRTEKIFKDIEGTKKVTILGITYKPNIDDMRESPILELVDLLEEKNYDISIVDPYVKEYKHLEKDMKKAAKDSDLLILAVNHNDFKGINFDELGKEMRNKKMFDTRNYFDQETLSKSGFEYYLLGEKGNQYIVDQKDALKEIAVTK
ncbi:UDP-N-acetyl-D-mannosamine dehydrogenase [Crassaminicella profunda]|uniref:UDP-N-acetyl-D-mannosamine dehydrogenase n=1 Tax=Crassaminicella profunda TaxID=1286698 RepID=UPI001CA68D68|nr:UDP-N-acetyl-D-mannosamine dehydrogenase [Crassaminicella profunda]QZY55329.1 UDP-N-acetyl-D-mannosamine dehydrogenase [Crassaminicella profunda]